MSRAPLQRDRQAAPPQGASPDAGRTVVGGSVESGALSLADALERLASPYVEESYSPLTGEGILLVDLRLDTGRLPDTLLDIARTALARLPCPSVAIGAAPASPVAMALTDHFDVVLSDDVELAAVLAGVRRTPLAATALVQLLRHSAGLDAHAGLIAESLVYSTLQAGPEFGAWKAGRSPRPAIAEELGPAVLVKRSDDCLELTLNRPRKHNAFSAEMRDGLVEGLRVAVGDASIAEVVVRGAGESFSSGGDLDEFGTLPDPATAHAIRSTRNAARLLADCAARTRFEVQGACVGAGAELPAFARRVVTAKDAYFQLPELSMGLVPGAGGTVSIPRRIGRQRAAWMALSGRRIDAETALRWGLVDELRK